MWFLKAARITALSALVLVLLVARRPTPAHAQFGDGCYSYDVADDDCPTCCAVHNHIMEITNSSGSGRDGVGYADLNCGSNANCNGGNCSFPNLPVVESNTCCQGIPCDSDADCPCAGYICFTDDGVCEEDN
jgi:hypothetical protein